MQQKWRDTIINESIERNDSSISVETEEMNKVQQSNPIVKSEREDNHHYAVELADWKSRLRKQRQELYILLYILLYSFNYFYA